MLRIFTICSLVLFTTLAKASDTITIALKTFVKVAVEDGQGGIFILGRNNSVSKYNEEGKKVATYTSNDAVECTQMFMYQGMQLALFYRDLQRIILLDQNLREFGRFDLNQDNLRDLTAITAADTPYLWAWDNQSSKLLKIDLQGNVQSSSQYLQNYKINQIINHGKYLLLLSGDKKLVVMNSQSKVLGAMKLPIQVMAILPNQNGQIEYLYNGTLDLENVIMEGVDFYPELVALGPKQSTPVFKGRLGSNSCEVYSTSMRIFP
jgi:hypothetical protein